MFLGPTPVWDSVEGAALEPAGGSSWDSDAPELKVGTLNQVVWMCWTGSNAMPVHLQLCLRTIRRNADVPVILVTPKNVLRYGGIYVDTDTICLRSLRGLFDLLDTCDAVGYDGSAWNEHIGVSAMGPFKPQSDLTTLWFNALHGKLAQRWADVQARQTDVFYWQEILRDIVLPASLIHRERISRAMQIHNPEQDALWSERPCAELLGAELDRCHLLVLNNAKYGQELGELSEDELLGSPVVLGQLLRRALGLLRAGSG